MNAKWKIGIYAAGILIIGIAVGALLNRAMVGRWIREALAMRQAGLRAPRAARFFKPTDALQEAKIQRILDQHEQKMSEIHARYRKEIEVAFKSLKNEVDPILTPEQRAEFEKHIPGPPPPELGGLPGFPGGAGPEGFPDVRGPGGPGRGGPPPGDLPLLRGPYAGVFGLALLKIELQLSEDQHAKLGSIQQDYEKKVGWNPSSPVPPPGRDVLIKLEQEMQEAVLRILTDEQKVKFRRLLGLGSEPPRPPTPAR